MPGPGFGVTVTGFDRLDALLLGVAERAADAKPWLNDVADKVELIAAASFHDEGPNWAPLKPSTQADRRRKGYQPEHPILVRRGDLKTSAVRGKNHIRRFKGTRSIEVGSRDFKALFHELGTRNMRARPFYVVTLADVTVMRLGAADYLLGRWGARAAVGVLTRRDAA